MHFSTRLAGHCAVVPSSNPSASKIGTNERSLFSKVIMATPMPLLGDSASAAML